MKEFLRRIWYRLNRRRLERELASDMEFHREMAVRQGRSNFGNALQLREQAREAWGWIWMDRLMQDAQYAARILFRAPGFAITALLVLGIGIGVNITAFSLFNLMALKPLPVREPNSIVRLQRRSPENVTTQMPYPCFAFYRAHTKTLRSLMAIMAVPAMQVEDDLQPATASFITANYFSELGTRAAAGRLNLPWTTAGLPAQRWC